MTKETLGYMKLEWTCPRCNSRNPGEQKTCLSCGAPQPEDIAFHLPEKHELLEDEDEIAQAKKGADIHCPYCGARNPPNTEACAQCGGSLTEGTKRQAGAVLGAFQPQGAEKTILCPNCAAPNKAQALTCVSCGAPLPRNAPAEQTSARKSGSKMGWLVAAALMLLLSVCVVFFVLSSRTEEISATVKDAYWQTRVVIEGLHAVERSAWREQVPSEATILECQPKVHHIQEEAVPNANKVCGTPYTVDTGGGYAEVVQDCVYEVLLDYCSYTVMEWQTVETLTQEGKDLPVVFASYDPTTDQRLGEQSVSYLCVFESSQGELRYSTHDENIFRQCTAQSEWLLRVNSFGQIISLEPK